MKKVKIKILQTQYLAQSLIFKWKVLDIAKNTEFYLAFAKDDVWNMVGLMQPKCNPDLNEQQKIQFEQTLLNLLIKFSKDIIGKQVNWQDSFVKSSIKMHDNLSQDGYLGQSGDKSDLILDNYMRQEYKKAHSNDTRPDQN